MKKLCFVTTVSLTVRAFVIPVVRHMRAHTDWEITVICDDDPTLQAELPQGVRYLPVSMKRGISIGGIGAVWKMYSIFRREKFDLVQFSTPNAALYASVASWLAGIRQRKYHLMGFRYLGFTGVKKWLFKSIERFCCALSTDVECVSPSNLELGIREKVFPRKKAAMLLHGSSAGIDLTRYDIGQRAVWRKALRDKYGYGENHCVFGFAGRITKDKGIDELLEAFEGIDRQNARLFLAGVFEDRQALDAERLSRAEGSDDVTFCGYVDDIEKYFAMMDVLVLPSYREGFGNIVIEAQAMGTPVIVTDIPGPTDAMLPEETGLVVSVKDAAALRNAMQTMVDDCDRRTEMGRRGRLFTEECFDQQKLCDVILHDRKRLLGQ